MTGPRLNLFAAILFTAGLIACGAEDPPHPPEPEKPSVAKDFSDLEPAFKNARGIHLQMNLPLR